MSRKILSIIIIFAVISCSGKNMDEKSADSTAVSETVSQAQYQSLPHISESRLMSEVHDIPQLTSFLLYQDGEIISEYYTGGMSRNRHINIKSASKSIISALVGIALREGYISSVDDPVADYLPDYFKTIDEPGKHAITIRHLLTMSTGLRSTSIRNYGSWVTSGDWVAYALNEELQQPPGARMRYSTGDTHILSAVLTEATGMSTRAFAENYLFGPMNVRIGGWDRDPAGYYFGGNNMAMNPAGMLAFGRLFLENGRYDGVQLLPADWVADSFTPHFMQSSFNPRRHDYGYLWWHNTFSGKETWFAWGYGGQYLFVVPGENVVLVITGNPDSRAAGLNNRIYTIFEEIVIPYIHHNGKS